MPCTAPPFHPAGQAPRAVCPVCVNKQNNGALKQMYAVSGFAKGQYDSEIPHHFFQCPPIALDTKEGGMDALRVCHQTLDYERGSTNIDQVPIPRTCYIRYCYCHQVSQPADGTLSSQGPDRQIEAGKDGSRDRNSDAKRADYLSGRSREKVQSQRARDQALSSAVRSGQEVSLSGPKLCCSLTKTNRELDRRNEDLRRLGYNPPQIDYSFPPSCLYEDDTSTRRSEHVNGTNPRIMDDHIPSVSSTTLRGDSSRARKDPEVFGESHGLTSCKTQRIICRDPKARGENLTSIATSHTTYKVRRKAQQCRSGLELDLHLHPRSPTLFLRRADIFNNLVCHIRLMTRKLSLYMKATVYTTFLS